jgi:tRNA G10  N-methylase Trm11
VVVYLPRRAVLTDPPNGVAQLNSGTSKEEVAVPVLLDDAIHTVHLRVRSRGRAAVETSVVSGGSGRHIRSALGGPLTLTIIGCGDRVAASA